MSIHIEGRRWFQRTYGNTYHSVTIFKDGEVVARCPHAYGYDDGYLQTALELLKDKGLAPKDAEQGTRYLRETLGASWGVVDVERMKDL